MTPVQLTELPDPTQLHKCYNIPYGVFGFFPKLIAYFSLVVALVKPGINDDDDDYEAFSDAILYTFLSSVMWLCQVIPAAIMIHECRGEYQMLAIWKTTATISDLCVQSILRFAGYRAFLPHYMAVLVLLRGSFTFPSDGL